MNRSLAALICLGLVSQVVSGATAQVPRVEGKANVPVPRPKPPAPEDARVLSADEFRKAPLEEKQKVMRAWAAGSPQKAGPRILPMLAAGMSDGNQQVVLDSIAAYQNVQGAANIALATKRSPELDPSTFPELRSSITALLKHSTPLVRGRAVQAVGMLDVPMKADTETLLLDMLSSEKDGVVKSHIQMALSSSAKTSARSREALLKGIDDPDHSVRTMSIMSLARHGNPDDVKVIMRRIGDEQALVRRVVIRAADSYGARALPYLDELTQRLKVETDAAVHADLKRLVEKLTALKPPAP